MITAQFPLSVPPVCTRKMEVDQGLFSSLDKGARFLRAVYIRQFVQISQFMIKKGAQIICITLILNVHTIF